MNTFLTKNFSTIITIFALLSTLIGSWYTVKLSLDQVQKDIDKIQSKNSIYDQQFRLVDIQSAEDMNNIKRMKEDIAEIKQDVKSLLRKIH
jgi:uncharacterized membrane protein (DUF106 family)